MAWQLIYTSAPRLLEAGRTGFGTVARHRAAGGLIADTVERFSQFARLPGLGARRIVFSHRVVQAGASKYHVLSCIRDAGSDYTGRTNHLAQHIITEAREVLAAIEAGVTPADVLMQMKWRSSWAEPPRFMEPGEEISLTSLRPRTFGSAWERIAARAELAALPAQAQRCFIILPGETEALGLFQESMSTLGAAAWQVTFTTHLEPTDDSSELRWIGLSAASPLRHQADGVARSVLDLTQPQSLIYVNAPAASTQPVRSSREAFTSAQTLPRTEIVTAQTLPTPSGSFMEPLPIEKAKRRGPGLIAALAAVLGIGGGIFFYTWLSQHAPPSPALKAADRASRVDALWQHHHLTLRATATWLKGRNDAALIQSHETALQQITEALREPGRPAQISLPESTQDEFMEMLQSFIQWQRHLQKTQSLEAWNGSNPTQLRSEVRTVLETQERLWKAYAKNFSSVAVMPETLQQEISRQLMKQLTKSTQPEGSPADWREVITLINKTVPTWLAHWVSLTHAASADPASLRSAAKDQTAPPWLVAMATDQLNKITSQQQADQEAGMAAQRAEVVAKPELIRSSAEGPSSSHPRFIVIETAELSLNQAMEQMPALPVQADMQIVAGSAGFAEANLVRWRALGAPGVYRKSFTDPSTLEIQKARLTKAPSEKEPTRIIARNASGSEVLFEILCLTKNASLTEAWHTDPGFTFTNQASGSRSVLDASAARWLAQMSFAGARPTLRLQSLTDPTHHVRLRLDGSEAVLEVETKQQQIQATTARVSKLHLEIESFQQGIITDEQRKKEVAGSKLATREKDDSIRRFVNAISTKEMRILEMQEELRGLTTTTASNNARVSLPAGRYVLAAIVNSSQGVEKVHRLCELTITAQPAINTQ